jgi:hypothetical protein
MYFEYFILGLLLITMSIWFMGKMKRVILFLVFFIPFEEFVLKFIPVSDEIYSLLRYGSEFLLLVTLIALIIKKVIEKKPFAKTGVNLPVVVFVSCTFLSSILNQTSFLETVLFIRIVLRYYALYFIVVNLDLDEKFSKKLIKGLISIAVIQFTLALAQVLIGSHINKFLLPRPVTLTVGSYYKEWLLVQGLREKGYLVFGTFGDTVNLGLFIYVILVVMIGVYFLQEKPIKKMWLFFLFSFLTILFTYSVGLIFTVFISLLFLTLIKKKWSVVIVNSLLVVLLFLMVTFYKVEFTDLNASLSFASPLEHISASFSNTFMESARSNRIFTFMQVPKVIFSQSALLGFGPGWRLIKDKISTYWLGDVYWAQILAQVGLFGLLAFLWIFWRFYKNGLKVYRNSNEFLKKGIAFGFLGVLVGVFFYDFICAALETRPLAFFFWLFAGLVGNWSKSTQENRI